MPGVLDCRHEKIVFLKLPKSPSVLGTLLATSLDIRLEVTKHHKIKAV